MRVFSASEREFSVSRLASTESADADEIIKPNTVCIWSKFHQYDSQLRRPEA